MSRLDTGGEKSEDIGGYAETHSGLPPITARKCSGAVHGHGGGGAVHFCCENAISILQPLLRTCAEITVALTVLFETLHERILGE